MIERKESTTIGVVTSALLGLFSWFLAPALHAESERALKIGNGASWSFFNGSWTDGTENALEVPQKTLRQDGPAVQGDHYAFFKDAAYQDLRARFEIRLMGHTDAGLIFRAHSPGQFYVLHFPACGQQNRAQHFWASLSRMDEDGYWRIVKLELVRRVPSTAGVWLPVDVVIRGDSVQARIGEAGIFQAQDSSLRGPGRVGVFLFGAASIRNVRIEGVERPGSSWNESKQPPQNWFYPSPQPQAGSWQRPGQLVRTPKGDLLLTFNEGGTSTNAKTVPFSIRSKDNGKTWSKPERIASLKEGDSLEEGQSGQIHVFPDGKLRMMVYKGEQVSIAESTDDGRSWEPATPVVLPPNPSDLGRKIVPGSFVNLRDGAVLAFGLSYHNSSLKSANIWQWGSHHTQAFATRSEDNGKTWSEWKNLDNPGLTQVTKGDQIGSNLDLTEVCAVQTGTGKIMALIRPIYSPWMWEASSTDGGKTWGPVVRGPFPGYATPNMPRTASGAILVAHRQPNLTVHSSLDDGITWDEGTRIDSGLWAMGSMLEVEPNVVLYVYYDSFYSRMRAQFIRVTPRGIEPVRDR
ncbi:MAG: exo-alpha-sialidase [Acidimicrobiia bacterium]|nr:exo-alpha-sialidase [Acidimicrobiia bacterium]